MEVRDGTVLKVGLGVVVSVGELEGDKVTVGESVIEGVAVGLKL